MQQRLLERRPSVSAVPGSQRTARAAGATVMMRTGGGARAPAACTTTVAATVARAVMAQDGALLVDCKQNNLDL